jgi:hypothetical protein
MVIDAAKVVAAADKFGVEAVDTGAVAPHHLLGLLPGQQIGDGLRGHGAGAWTSWAMMNRAGISPPPWTARSAPEM